jgi:hypothetical protein
MRWLSYWAVVTAGAALSSPACLTSQDGSGGGSRPEDPPGNGGSGGSAGTSRGGTSGEAGEATGGSSRGGSAGTAGTGNGEGGSDGGCVDDGDCAFRFDNRSICSVPSGECVDCLTIADCGSNEECVDNECLPITPCSSTPDCPLGQVCNPSTDRCVQCVGSGDCGAGEVCALNVCRTECAADSHCSLFGLVCDESAGFCVNCASNNDCAGTRNCQAGSCVRDICVGGTATCESGGLATCNDAGSSLGAPIACLTRQTCTEDRAGAGRCADWVCTPSSMGCSLTSERRVTCSADGLEETVVEDCAASMQLCIDATGMCADAVCEPNETFCQGNTIQLCNSTGTASSLYQTCTTAQFCNPTTVMCVAQLCSPNMPACDGNVFTTCNATGNGYTGTRTDCTTSDQFCSLTGCTTSAVDTVGATTLSGTLANYGMLNIYSVTGNRTLAQIEQYMSISAALTLTWHVYESTTATGTYTSISNTTTTSTTGAGYQSSGALMVPMVAGRYYAIGASWTGSVNYGLISGTASQAVTFGSLISAIAPTPVPTTTISVGSPPGYYFPQRLTTTP